MAYDQELANRIRLLFSDTTSVTERKMFGGLAFLVNGNMTITVSGKGGILARVGPEQYSDLCEESSVEVAVMKGRKMKGWLRVPAENLATQKQLKKWFDHCMDYADKLPLKDRQ